MPSYGSYPDHRQGGPGQGSPRQGTYASPRDHERTRRYAWRYLDTDEAARLWDEVTDWVWWLRDRYELGERIPRCWYRHGPVVEEFTALMAGWSEMQDTGRGMSQWHSRDLWPLIDRLESISGFEQCQADGCSHDSGFQHAPEGTESIMEPVPDTDDDMYGESTYVDATVVGVLTEDVMLSAVVSGDATALDAGQPRGRYHLSGRLWTWSSILGGYVPSRESIRALGPIDN